MRYALLFALLGMVILANGVLQGGWGLVLLWPGFTFLVVALAYAGLGPSVFGKRPDGRLAPTRALLLLPYLLPSLLLWHLVRLLSREPCCHRVDRGLWLGRRALAHEIPEGVDFVVDLTAEFPEPRGVRSGRTYLCFPTLDGGVPDAVALPQVVWKVATWPGVVYLHCASGHGRSALLAAAVLLARGQANTAAEAEALVRAARPGVRLSRGQREALEVIARRQQATV